LMRISFLVDLGRGEVDERCRRGDVCPYQRVKLVPGGPVPLEFRGGWTPGKVPKFDWQAFERLGG